MGVAETVTSRPGGRGWANCIHKSIAQETTAQDICISVNCGDTVKDGLSTGGAVTGGVFTAGSYSNQ